MSFNSRFVSGTGEDYFPAAPLPPFLGNVKKLSAGFTLRPSSRFRFDETYLYYRLGTRNGSTPPGFIPGQNIFNNHLMRAKLNYQFTKELSLRLILDYNATIANANLVDLQTILGGRDGGPFAPTKHFTTDVLLTYLLHPGTAVYAGYNNGFTDLSLANAATGIGPRGSPANTTNRLFFVKLSYLFRY